MAKFKKEKKAKIDINLEEKREIDACNKEQALNKLLEVLVENKKKVMDKKHDSDLNNLKEQVQMINGDYKEQLALIDAKINYIVQHLGKIVGGNINATISELGD